MANQQQVAILKQGVDVWNKWRDEHPEVEVDLSKADFSNVNLIEAFAGLRYPTFHRANLGGAHFNRANLRETNFHKADLAGADFSEADLKGADLSEAYLKGADLRKADLAGARLNEADLRGANLTAAQLNEADLRGANLSNAHLLGAKLSKAYLKGADLLQVDLTMANLNGTDLSNTFLKLADLRGADLREANLTGAILVGTKIDKAKLSGSSVHAVNVSDLSGDFEEQKDLVITPYGSPVVTVDHIQIAQFLHLILNHAEIRDGFHAQGSNAVLILGSFGTAERKAMLNALRNALREDGYLPITFDFDRATEKDFIQTIHTLVSLVQFIIADVTNPKAAPLELQGTIPDYQVPLVPIIQAGEELLPVMIDLQEKYNWVLDTVSYDSTEMLLHKLKPAIIDPAVGKHREIQLRKTQHLML